MKKTTFLIACILFNSNLSFADANVEAERLKVMEEYYKAQGLPWPGAGIIVDKKATPKMKASSHHTFTRVDKFNHNVRAMLDLEHKVKQEKKIMKTAVANDKSSTHLRHDIKQFNSVMAYPFKGVPKEIATKNFGFAPILAYKEGHGWVGATNLFKAGKMNCQFNENNIKLSMAAMKIDENEMGHEVNKKYTETTISGNDDSGYMYSVDWYDNNFFRHLECADMVYSEDTMKQIISMACKIDSYQDR